MKSFAKLCSFSFILSLNLLCKSQSNIYMYDTSCLINDLNHIIYTISNDSMGGRPAGTVYEIKTLNFLINNIITFLPNNYEITIDEFYYHCNNNLVIAHNISILPRDVSNPIFLLTAHYDHLRQGSSYSREIINKNQIHPGADDNASGVALAVELFKILFSNKSNDTLYPKPALILFSGHEEGMHGSDEWICKYNKLYDIDFVLNFDMVGRMDDNESILLIRQSTNNEVSDKLFFKNFTDNAKQCGINIKYTNEGFRQTDAYNFYINQIPSYTISTGIHTDYHRVSDTPGKINYQSIQKIINLFLYQIFDIN